MPTKYFYFLLSAVIVFSLFLFLSTSNSYATVSSCSASISPASVNTNRSNEFSLILNNTSSEDILWIRVTKPSENFTLNSIGLTGWPGSANGTYGILTGGSLSGSESATIFVTATSGSSEASSANWVVEVSDDEGGNDLTVCTGSLGTAISGVGSSDATAPVISDIVVSDVSQTTVKITWSTDENSDSVIDYGTSEDYGSTKSDSGMTTSHSLTLDNLSANTTYHFNVKSTDASNNTAEAGDNTFVSSKASTTSTTTVTNTTTTTVTKLVEDTERPGITFTTKFDKPFSTTPEVTGKVTDNAGVSGVEYSIDGGLNYLPVDELNSPRSKSSLFSFQLSGLLDGNYKVRVRASDLTGNVSVTEPKTLIFDRLAPSTGGVIYTLGSYVLESDSSGNITTLAGLTQKIVLSAVGGPTEIRVTSNTLQVTSGKTEESKTFELSKNSDTGLWSGNITFEKEGVYNLEVISTDGAENKVVKSIGRVFVLPKGRVSTPESNLSVYYFETSIKSFVLWDGEAYGQKNPIVTDESGKYSLVLPRGKYYLEVKSKEHGIRNSEIFTLGKITPINTDFDFSELKKFTFGPLNFTYPSVFQPSFNVSSEQNEVVTTSINDQDSLVGKEFPDFNLVSGEFLYDNFYFRGKKTIYFLLNTWLPQTASQIASIEEVLGDRRLNTVILVPQESVSKTMIFKKRGNYQTLFLADPDGVLFSTLGVNKLPAFIITDRKGIVEGVGTGILTKDQISEKL